MLDSGYVISVLVAMGLVTFALRALPFVAAQWLQKHPVVHSLGEFLPLAIMTLLLTHTVVGAAQSDPHGPWPELVAVVVVLVLQWRARHALWSITAGTGLYVVLRNFNLLGG